MKSFFNMANYIGCFLVSYQRRFLVIGTVDTHNMYKLISIIDDHGIIIYRLKRPRACSTIFSSKSEQNKFCKILSFFFVYFIVVVKNSSVAHFDDLNFPYKNKINLVLGAASKSNEILNERL